MQQISEPVILDIFLMNGHKISVNITSTDQTEDVLEVSNDNFLMAQEISDDNIFFFFF